MNIENLEDLIKNNDLESLEKLTEQIAFVVINTINNNSVPSDLSDKIKVFNSMNESICTELDLYNDTEKQKICNFATIKTLFKVLELHMDKSKEEEEFIKLLRSHSYLKKIITYLNKNNSMSSVELSNVLGMKKSTLLGYMTKLEKYKFFSSFDIEGSKVYFINSNGVKLNKFIMDLEKNKDIVV